MSPIRLGTAIALAVWCVAVGVGGSASIAAAAQEGETLWGPETEGLRLGVAVAKTAFGPGEPVLVRATVANTSSVRRSLPLEGYPPFWIVDVLRLPGEAPVQYTEFAKAVYGLTPGGWDSGGHLAGIKPGQKVHEVLCVSRLRDMTYGRAFRIVIAYRVPTKGGEPITLQAPPLEIQVTMGTVASERLQNLVLRPDDLDAGFSAAAVGESVKELAAGLQDVAAGHPKARGGQAARAQLERLRADIDAMLSELDKAASESAPTPAPMAHEGKEPEPAAPAPAAGQPREEPQPAPAPPPSAAPPKQ